MMFVSSNSNTMGVTCGAVTALALPEHAWFLVRFVLLDLYFSVQCFLRFTTSDYLFGIFKLFLVLWTQAPSLSEITQLRKYLLHVSKMATE